MAKLCLASESPPSFFDLRALHGFCCLMWNCRLLSSFWWSIWWRFPHLPWSGQPMIGSPTLFSFVLLLLVPFRRRSWPVKSIWQDSASKLIDVVPCIRFGKREPARFEIICILIKPFAFNISKNLTYDWFVRSQCHLRIRYIKYKRGHITSGGPSW